MGGEMTGREWNSGNMMVKDCQKTQDCSQKQNLTKAKKDFGLIVCVGVEKEE